MLHGVTTGSLPASAPCINSNTLHSCLVPWVIVQMATRLSEPPPPHSARPGSPLQPGTLSESQMPGAAHPNTDFPLSKGEKLQLLCVMFASPIFISVKVANQFFLITTFPINFKDPTIFLFLRLSSFKQGQTAKPGHLS